MEQLLLSFLNKNKVFSFNEKDISLQLVSHSEYPSLRAITDTLDYFGIENVAANVPTDALDQLPKTFLALVKTDAGQELTLVIQNQSTITCISQDGNKKKITPAAFKDNWTGTLIAIEVAQDQATGFKPTISIASVMLSLALIVVIGVAFFSKFNGAQYAYTFLSAIGLGISYLINKEELGIKDTITTKVCGAISGSSAGCSNVINSREGKIFGSFGLGDLSLLFFVSTLLTSLLVKNANAIFLVLAIATVPVVLYTLIIQVFKLKQYCLLCMGISAVLLSQFAIMSSTINWEFSIISALQFLLITTASTVIWLFFKPLWKDSKELETTQRAYLKFKRNPMFFKQAISKTKTHNLGSLPSGHIISFGNVNAPIKLQAITNPFCGYCKEPFLAYTRLLKTHPKDIQLEIIFNVPLNNENDANKLTKTIIKLYVEDPDKALVALENWFKDRDIERWNKNYPECPSMLLQPQQVIESHSNWCQENEILYTPETLINGRSFPKNEYDITDLPFFIEEVKEPKTLQKII